MNILYLSTVFPMEGENSTIYTDLAVSLVERGHSVTVVAADEKKKSTGTKLLHERSCSVLRVRTGNMYDVNIIEKGISILSLEMIMSAALRKYLKGKHFDLILFEAPPVTLSGVVKEAKKLFHAPAFLMMKDIFPQNAVDIGMMKKGSVVERFFRMKEKKLYNVADNIGCMSEGNRSYIAEHSHVPMQKLSVFPNTKKIKPVPEKDIAIRDKYNIPKDKVVFVFGGNMGKPQGMRFLAKGVQKAEKIREAFFVLVGRGTEREKVKEVLKDSRNVLILDNLPRDEYEVLISSCDVGIVSLDYRFTIPNYPSRILSYMEYGMPVLAYIDRNTDFRELIEESGCGYWCESNNPAGFMEKVKLFCRDADSRSRMGDAGRKYMEENFAVEMSVELLEGYCLKSMNNGDASEMFNHK